MFNGTIELRNPDPKGSGFVRSEPFVFTSQEYATHEEFIPRTVRAFKADNKSGDTVDIFEELAPDGNLEIWVQCTDPAQFFGMGERRCVSATSRHKLLLQLREVPYQHVVPDDNCDFIRRDV